MNDQPRLPYAEALASARRTFTTEIAALQALQERLGEPFALAVDRLLACKGRVIVSGLGKSGHIARKIAATLSSTGTPAFFMHGAEAIHGDLGMITPQDIVIAISYSGSAPELLTVLGVVKRMGASLIAMTGNPESDLARNADLHLDCAVEREACPLNLAPTASTTATLVLGDALAVACLEARRFNSDDFARSHPGGALGRRLLTLVRDVMRQGDALPLVHADMPIPEALAQMSSKGMGMTIVVTPDKRPVGIFTDGDLRRLILREGDIRFLDVAAGMTPNPRTIAADALAVEAAALMDTHKLNQLLVVDESGLLTGALHMHDLLAAKVI
ncbi:KpsF/GutQ family sugar-phosphate isomerase [Paracandidimonas soli]|uniref:KpsF/GutQ family sugar-phosphate isomerase n=1 Tax=Paracandidimonas soli TaxID=1917182 RepID=UPI000ACB6F77